MIASLQVATSQKSMYACFEQSVQRNQNHNADRGYSIANAQKRQGDQMAITIGFSTPLLGTICQVPGEIHVQGLIDGEASTTIWRLVP